MNARTKVAPSEAGFRHVHTAATILVLAWSFLVLVSALAAGYDAEHGLTEALLPAGLGIVAAWSWPDRWQRVALASAGLATAQAITVHLFEGTFWTHALFFAIVVLLTWYRHPAVPWFLLAHLLFVHFVIGSIDPHSVYGHGWTSDARFLLVASQVSAIVGSAAALRALSPGHHEPRGPIDEQTR